MNTSSLLSFCLSSKKTVQACIIFCFAWGFISSCTEQDPPEPWRKNAYASLFLTHTNNHFDSIVISFHNGKEYRHLYNEKIMGSFPHLYKDKVISLTSGFYHSNLCLFDPATMIPDTICKEILVLSTSSIDEYEKYAVIRQFNGFHIIDTERREIVVKYDCPLDNLILDDENYYFVRTSNSTSKPVPYLCRGSIHGEKEIKLTEFPEEMGTEFYMDNTAKGWNGMTIVENMLFLRGIKNLYCYDLLHEKMVDTQKASSENGFRLNNSGNPEFFEGQEVTTFDMKKKRFI